MRGRDRLPIETQLQRGRVGCERDGGLARLDVATHRVCEAARVRDAQVEPVEDVGRGLFQGRDGERPALRAAYLSHARMRMGVMVKVYPPCECAGGEDAVFGIVAGAGVVD